MVDVEVFFITAPSTRIVVGSPGSIPLPGVADLIVSNLLILTRTESGYSTCHVHICAYAGMLFGKIPGRLIGRVSIYRCWNRRLSLAGK